VTHVDGVALEEEEEEEEMSMCVWGTRGSASESEEEEEGEGSDEEEAILVALRGRPLPRFLAGMMMLFPRSRTFVRIKVTLQLRVKLSCTLRGKRGGNFCCCQWQFPRRWLFEIFTPLLFLLRKRKAVN
jgi:hypothetical protein